MPIDVTVTEHCHRCKRKEQITISSDKIDEFEQKDAAAKAHEQSVVEFVESHKGHLPDLVVIFKGQVQMLSNVCDAYCAKTVQNGVDTLFREHKQRKPRTQKTPEEKAADKAAKEAKAKAEADKAAKDKKKK